MVSTTTFIRNTTETMPAVSDAWNSLFDGSLLKIYQRTRDSSKLQEAVGEISSVSLRNHVRRLADGTVRKDYHLSCRKLVSRSRRPVPRRMSISSIENSFSKVRCYLPITACILNRYAQATSHLGLRQMEWLFLTRQNYWIVFRLERDGDHLCLAYLQEISMKDSTEPFQHFLGIILSVVKNILVEPRACSSEGNLLRKRRPSTIPYQKMTSMITTIDRRPV